MLRFFCVPFELKIRPKQQLSTPRGKNSHIVRCIYIEENFNFVLLKFKRGLPRHANSVCIKKYEWESDDAWGRERESAMYFRKMNVCCSCRYDCLHKKILIFSLSVNKINKSFLSITDDSLVQPIHPSIHPFSLIHLFIIIFIHLHHIFCPCFCVSIFEWYRIEFNLVFKGWTFLEIFFNA